MWTVIYMAQSKEAIEQMKQIMNDNKIITKIRAMKKSEEDLCYEILVPASEICDAQGLILENEL